MLSTTADFETVRMMKEKLCYVGYYHAEQKLAQETTFLVEQYTFARRQGLPRSAGEVRGR